MPTSTGGWPERAVVTSPPGETRQDHPGQPQGDPPGSRVSALSNTKLEGLASKVGLINHRRYGHHSAAAVISMI